MRFIAAIAVAAALMSLWTPLMGRAAAQEDPHAIYNTYNSICSNSPIPCPDGGNNTQ